MTKTFRSRTDKRFILVVGVPMFLIFTLMLFLQSMPGIIMATLTSAFVLYLVYNTWYAIEQDVLHIRCGFLYRKEVPVKSIKSIATSSSILSSPATSFDRIEIAFNQFDSVLISPENRQDFIESLKNINPAIIIKS